MDNAVHESVLLIVAKISNFYVLLWKLIIFLMEKYFDITMFLDYHVNGKDLVLKE